MLQTAICLVVNLSSNISLLLFSKEIAMVTHQLMSTRHMQMIQEQKNKQMAAEGTKCFSQFILCTEC